MTPPTARSRCGIYHKPLVLLIWFGAVLMAFGGAAVAVRPAAARRRAEARQGRARLQAAE
jgi:cytochrome c biogenesis factor